MKKFIYELQFTGSLLIEADSEEEALGDAEAELKDFPIDKIEITHCQPNEGSWDHD